MKILAFALSLRKESCNKKLINLAGKLLQQNTQIECRTLELVNYDIPNYNQDIQDGPGFPESVKKLKIQIDWADALVLSTPEYNFSMPGHFKNTYDWISRFRPMPWTKKWVLILSASPSMVGGNRGAWALRVPFEACGAFVYPDMFSLAQAHQAFGQDGQLKDKNMQNRLEEGLLGFTDFVGKMRLESKS